MIERFDHRLVPCRRPSRSVNKHHAARRDAYGGTRDGRHDAQSRGRAGTCRPALDQRLTPRRAMSPAARPESSPTSLLQTAVRQLRRLSLHVLPLSTMAVSKLFDSKSCRVCVHVSATVSRCQGICATHRATPRVCLEPRRRRRRCCRRHSCRQSSADANRSRYSGHQYSGHQERASWGMVHCGHARCTNHGVLMSRMGLVA